MTPQLPKLHILPLSSLILHEDNDRQRTLPLVDKLRAQGILRNPPLVMPLEDKSGRYMVLDGANRVTALQELEFPHIVAQVVSPGDPGIRLDTWHHVVWGMGMDELLANIRSVGGLKLIELKPGQPRESGPDCLPVEVQLADGRIFLTCTTKKGLQQMAYLHGIVDSYKEKAFLDRTSESSIDFFRKAHNNLTALFIYPHFDIRYILSLAGDGHLLPAGLTRFTVAPRALHLNYPLHEMSSGKPIEFKEAYLSKWLQERIKNKNIRFYEEATFLYDE
jgi:hypothetical protein